MSQTVNPYEAPKTAVTTSARVVKPRIAPRDAIDWLLGLLITMATIGVLGMVFVIGASLWILFSLPSLTGLILYLVLLIAGLLPLLYWGTRNIVVDDRGITLVRGLGTTQFMNWDEVHGIRLLTRQEFFWGNIFRPQNYCLACFSLRDYCCIDGVRGQFFFPPRDPESFIELVTGQIQPAGAAISETGERPHDPPSV